MDSITQIALGATVAAAVGFKPFGRRVLIAGAVLGTLPDLDVVIDYGNNIDNYTSHRGFSHSLFVLTGLAILLYLLAINIKPQWKAVKLPLFAVILLPLITHPLLDAFTTYGTQLFWPLTSPPVSWSSIFIIDPLYTAPLLIAMLGLWFSKKQTRWLKVNRVVLLFSCFYLAFGLFSQWQIQRQVSQHPLAHQGLIKITPTPFNTMIWRVLSYHQDSYYETFTWIGDTRPLQWQQQPTNRELISDLNFSDLQRLEWFTQGLLAFENNQGTLEVIDLRMGFSNYYPFVFAIAKNTKQWQRIEPQQVEMAVPSGLSDFLSTIFQQPINPIKVIPNELNM